MTKYINEKQVSELTGISVHTLRSHRFQSKGFPYYRLSSRCIRYSEKDIEQYMIDLKIDSHIEKQDSK